MITKKPEASEARTLALINKPAKAAKAAANGNGNGSAKPYQTITLNVPHELLASIDGLIADRNAKSHRKTNRTEYILDLIAEDVAGHPIKAAKKAKGGKK